MRNSRIDLRGIAASLAAVFLLGLLFGGCGIMNYKTRSYPIKYVEEINAAADRYGLDRYLVAAVVRTESSFRPEAVSQDGACGLMQVLPVTAEWIDFKRGSELPENGLYAVGTNLDYGCWFLRFLLDRYDGSVRNALVAYNAGYNRLESWLETGADENGELAEIPYAETRNYVSKVLDAYETYKDLYDLYDEKLG